MGKRNDGPGELIDILLIEPNPGDVRLLQEEFKDGKILNALHTVSDAKSAIDFLHQRENYSDKPTPDLILLDMQLPDNRSGLDILSELETDPKFEEIVVVVLTSSSLGEDIVKNHGFQVDEYIQKPVDHDDFVKFVREVEDFWLGIIGTN